MVSLEEISRKKELIAGYLSSNRIEIKEISVVTGPSVSLFKLIPGPKVRLYDIQSISEDFVWHTNLKGVRIERLGDAIGIEVANDSPESIRFEPALKAVRSQMAKMTLPIVLGYSLEQKIELLDLLNAPHLLIAGTSGQGKTDFTRTLMSSLLSVKDKTEVKFHLFDPKKDSFSSFEGSGVIYRSVSDSCDGLQGLCEEMENRLTVPSCKSPQIIVFVDEFADLTMPGLSPDLCPEAQLIYKSIIRIAQKGQMAGIHLILSTQRPSSDVITGLIKANIPTRIAFRTTTEKESKVILDFPGAEQLIGQGDMLFSSGGTMKRIQACSL